MKVVAFMQCLWLKDPERGRETMQRMEAQGLRERFLYRLLFHGGKSGRVLQATLHHWCERIVWEECTKEIGGNSGAVFLPDPVHMKAVIAKHNPTHILSLGKVASGAVESLKPNLFGAQHLKAVHPAARQHAIKSLRSVFAQLEELGHKIRHKSASSIQRTPST